MPARDSMRAGAPPELGACTVAVLMGGRSSEREISQVTGREVLAALAQPVPRGEAAGPRRALGVEIDADGLWRVGGEALQACAALERLDDVDVFFLGLHGGEGEDGTIQGLLRACGRPFTGSGVRSSALCMDKHAARLVAERAGLHVAPGVCFSRRDWAERRPELARELAALSSRGWVVKPRCGGSSVNTFVVAAAEELESRVEAVLAAGDDALVEERIAGIEVSCGVLGNHDETLEPLPPVEIRPAPGRFFDYEQKYAEDGARELCPPEGLAAEGSRRVEELALAAHRAAGCDGYSRTDFIVPRAPPRGDEPVMLEINTLPGLTPRSLLPRAAAVRGIDYRRLCLSILASGLRLAGRSP